MKRITTYRTLFGATKDTNLAELKTAYRNLVKEWHPDKFNNDEAKKAEAEKKSTEIIEGYHFLVSIAPETHEANKEEYTRLVTTQFIDGFEYKKETLKLFFHDKSEYEYFGVSENIYTKLRNSATLTRFARRHIYHDYPYRKISNMTIA
jgi:DnaJ-class molecular chaperone